MTKFEIWGNNYSRTDPNRLNYSTNGTLLFSETDYTVNYLNTNIYGADENHGCVYAGNVTYYKPIVSISNATNYYSYHIVVKGTYRATYPVIECIPANILTTSGDRISPSDIQISTNSTTGYPSIQKITSSSTINNTVNLQRLCIYELYRRIYPVVRDTNTIKLTDGTNTVTLTSTAGYPISKASDVTITSIANGNLLMYSTASNKWINSSSLPDNLFFLSDDGNNTRKMQFQLSGITAGQTRTLTVPDASCVIVGDTNTQTLTNKTLADPSNIILANFLMSATTSINISSSPAPSIGQVLTATTISTATWQTPSRALSGLTTDVTISNPSNGQLLKYDSATSKWINSTITLGTTTLAGCTDVTLSGVAENDRLIYSNSKWRNKGTSSVIQSSS